MVINQFHAIGDLLFCEPIFRHFKNINGEKPIVPVRDHLMYFSEYIDSARFVPMSKFQLDYESTDITNKDYLPLRFANQIVSGLKKDDHSNYENTMPDKYLLAGIDIEKWKDLKINFNIKKCQDLFKKLNIDSEYILVNNYSQAGTTDIKPKSNCKIIYMENIPGFTVMDWALVMMKAKENHHVSTSTFYVMQAACNFFGRYNGDFYIYPRPNDDGLKGISKLSVDYNLIRCE